MRRFSPEQVPRPSQDLEFLKVRAFKTIALEIGCGVGTFSIRSALSQPQRAFIAIEKTVERFGKFQTRLAHHPPLPNLFAVHSEAVSVITHGVPVASVDEIAILYPNPYPKPKQRNLRWHNRAFMGFLLERLKSGGRVVIATNVEDYFEEALEMMSRVWGLKVLEKGPVRGGEPRTGFEKKYSERGEICWNLVFEKP